MQTIEKMGTRRRRFFRLGGFTLLESMVAAVVLAILVLGVCGALSESYQQSETVQSTGTAVLLATQLSDEITSKPMGSTLGPGSLTSRSQYTTVANYNGYADNSTALPMLDGSSLDVTGSDNYTRSVAVTIGARPSIDTVSPTTDFAIVAVTVTGPDGHSVSIPKFVTNYSITR